MVIHKTAIISTDAEVAESVTVGPYSIIEDDVQIAEHVNIASHVLIASGTRIGKGTNVHHGAALGTLPQDLKFEGEKTTLEIGENTTIREFATLNRGTSDHWKTVVGNNCLLMAYSHVAHDCVLGNNVIIANSVNMAGHVTIEDFVGIGGMCPIHQFVRIGKHTFIGGGFRIPKDVPPYILAMGEPLKYGGLNSVGLSRRGFNSELLQKLKEAYRIIYRSNLLLQDALIRVEKEMGDISEIADLIEFFRSSERGVIR
jgi:UDP-N-acetylglucosamine acyltransferase